MRLTGYQVVLRSIEREDLEMVRSWRNDPEVARYMLSQSHISEEQQTAWFQKVQRDPAQQHFVIEYKGEPIGAANIKALGDAKELQSASCIEPGLYIASAAYRGNIIAFSPTLLLNDYCFEQLGVESLKAVVKAENVAAVKYNLRLGYQQTGRGELLELQLNFQDYQEHSKLLKALLSRPSRGERTHGQ